MDSQSVAYFSATAMALGLTQRGHTPVEVANSMPRFRFAAAALEKAAASSSAYDGLNISDYGLAVLASQPNSIIDAIRARIAPINLPVMVGSIGLTGIIGENQPLPVLNSVAKHNVQDFKTGVIVVFGREVIQHGSNAAESFISAMVRAAGVRSSNSGFIEALTADPNCFTMPASDGGDNSYGGILEAVALASASIELTESSKLYLIVSPRTALNLSMKYNSGQLSFPNVSPQGGELNAAITVMVSDDLPAINGSPTALLLDADGLLLNRGELFMKRSTEASLEMSDLPDGTGATINLFHSEGVALRITRTFGLATHRPCATLITGVDW